MPQGIEVYDASGNVIISVTDRLMRVIGILSTGTGAGSISVPGFSQGTPFALPVPKSGGFATSTLMAQVSISGTTLNWTNSYSVDTFIIYGVY